MSLLSNICELRKETCSPHESNSQVYVGLEHIDSGRFFLFRHGSPLQVRSTKSRFYPGDVLYGKLRPYLDKVVVAETEGICSTDIMVLEPIEVPPWFLCGILHSDAFIEHAKQTTHGVNHPRTSWSGIKEFKTITFSLPEQKKIAAVLLKIQRAIEMQEKIIQSLRDLKKSSMQHLFTHGLRSEKTKMTEIGEIPESWEVVKVGDVCESSAFGPRFSADLYSTEGDVLTLRTTDISDDGRIDYAQAPKANLDMRRFENHLLQISDCVVTRSGTCGIAAVFEGYEMPVLPGAFLIRVRLGSEMHPHFFRYYVNSPAGRSRILKIARGAIQKNISGTSLLAFEVPLPNIDEQRNLVESLSTVDAKLHAHESKKSVLQDLFKTTLNKLMTGEIRVGDLDIDVSEVEYAKQT